MSEALTYLKYIFNGFLTFVFTTMSISSGVTVGWIAVSVMVFGLMVRSVLNLPKGIRLKGDKSNGSVRNRSKQH